MYKISALRPHRGLALLFIFAVIVTQKGASTSHHESIVLSYFCSDVSVRLVKVKTVEALFDISSGQDVDCCVKWRLFEEGKQLNERLD